MPTKFDAFYTIHNGRSATPYVEFLGAPADKAGFVTKITMDANGRIGVSIKKGLSFQDALRKELTSNEHHLEANPLLKVGIQGRLRNRRKFPIPEWLLAYLQWDRYEWYLADIM